MSLSYKTPGVYIQELNAFPGSVVAVPTAIPVFIGYTEKAMRNGKSLKGLPIRIGSLNEYNGLFGAAYTHRFMLAPGTINPFDSSALNSPALFYFYNCLRLFFQNGGSTCYILSVGTYGTNGDEPAVTEINPTDFSEEVFEVLAKESEPSIVVAPEIVSTCKTNPAACYEVYQRILKHCHDTQSRFAILDVNYEDAETDILQFRQQTGNDCLNYGAAYYPWLNTAVVDASEINLNNFDCTPEQLCMQLPEPAVVSILEQWLPPADTDTPEEKETKKQYLHNSLMVASPVYLLLINEIKRRLNLLPPAAAIAGIYCLTDNARGVWKAPANVSLAGVISPSVNITSQQQEGMNTDAVSGKSVNAIRTFPGKGTLVWGGRTLDGNSGDWRYINVRRTIIMIEQSIRLACRAYIFEPNDANTWINIKSMLENFLINLWRQGALAGATPEDAFAVQIGLGVTMTAEDLLNGYLRVTILVAISRPAEFIVLTFQQQQQQS